MWPALFAAQPLVTPRTLHLLIVVAGLGAAAVWACVRWGSRHPVPRTPRRSGLVPLGSASSSLSPPGRNEDKRAHPRRTGWRVRVLITDAEQRELPREGLLVNRSRGGLGLLSPRPAEPGTSLSVRSTRAPSDAPWARVVVRRCKEKLGRWEIGCQFEDEPSLGLLTQFG